MSFGAQNWSQFLVFFSKTTPFLVPQFPLLHQFKEEDWLSAFCLTSFKLL